MQRLLQAHLLKPDDDEGRASLDHLVAETPRVSRDTRLHIYTNAYRSRLVEALSADFNALHAYLGDDAFEQLVCAYIERYPSQYFSLRQVGSNLSQFLQSTEPYAAHRELRDLAEFEWALCYAFDSADCVCASAADFSALAPGQWSELKLPLAPTLRLIELRSNAPLIWKSINAGEIPPAAEIFEYAQSWIVWRRELRLLFRSLDAIERTALAHLIGGATFGDVCAALSETLPEQDVPARAAALLQQWLLDGLIAALV